MRCSLCGDECSSDARFCAGCGADLREQTTGSAISQAERRQLTVMFCDLVDSTELSELLDLEDLRDVMRAYHESCARVIRRFDGQVAQVLGDGLLVYFGYPHAHEDDAANAVAAGLEMLSALRVLNESLAQRVALFRERPLRIRIGIHTGEVLVGNLGSGASHEKLALGETVNLASRLMTACQPQQVLISGATRRLVEGRFQLADLGALTIRGIVEPVEVCLARAALEDQAPSGRFATRGLTPLVGRDPELALLLAEWQRARAGQGRAVLVQGEAGVGKSRLLHAFRMQIRGGPQRFLEAQGSNQHMANAFYPIIGLIRRATLRSEIEARASPLELLERELRSVGLALEETVPLFASLLSIPLVAPYAEPPLSAEARRRRTLEAMLEWFQRLSGPVVFAAEDLHWMDPSTLELLERMCARGVAGSLLVIGTFRPGFAAAWQGATHLRLRALGAGEADQLVLHVAGERELGREVRQRIVERADGVPLFLEELTKTVLEAGAAREATVPATLRDSLMARLDRLGEARHVAALASVLGRRFPRGLLSAISEIPEEQLDQRLAQLVEAELLFEERDDRSPGYRFKHALIQDVAYESLLRRDRRTAHARAAEALERRFPERAARQPGLVASHWDRANRPREAVARYHEAGLLAIERSAHLEAIDHFERALALVGHVDEAERTRLEIRLRAKLGTVLATSSGYGNEEVAKHQARARELSQFVGGGPELYDALGGLYLYHSARADFKPASDLAAQLLELAATARDDFVEAWGHHFSGMSRFYEGRFDLALEHFEHAIDRKDAGLEIPDWSSHEHDLAVVSRSFSAMTLAILGRADASRDRIERAIEFGRVSPHPLNLAFSLGFSTLVYQVLGEIERVLANAETAIEVSSEQGFPVYLGMGCMMRGWAQAHLPGADRDAVISQMNRGMAHTSTTGTRTEGARALALLAEAQRALGLGDEALKSVLAAREFASAKESPYWDAELLRLEGELLLAGGPPASDRAEERLRAALACARAQGAAALGLKVALPLARLLATSSRRNEACDVLGASLRALPEDTDGVHHRAARDLLESLS